VPISSVRLNAGLLFAIPDSLLFFHADEDIRTYGFVLFDGAALEFPAFLESDLTFVAFTGRFKDPSSDYLLRDTQKRGITYPTFGSSLIAGAFSQIGGIEGTGFSFRGVPWNGPVTVAIYSYWNGKAWQDATERNDIQISLTTDAVRLNAFGGMRIDLDSADIKLRGGVTASLGDPDGNEFFTEFGTLDITPGADLTERAYLIFEPRLHRPHADFAISFFSSPIFSDSGTDPSTYVGTYVGANLLIALGSLDRDRVRGGMTVSGALDPARPGDITPLSFSVNPFIEFLVSDFLIDTALSINPFRLEDPATAGELRVSLKAVY